VTSFYISGRRDGLFRANTALPLFGFAFFRGKFFLNSGGGGQGERAGSGPLHHLEVEMLHYSLVFLVFALVAAFLGFWGIAGMAATIAKICFFVFLVLWVLTFFMGRRSVL
jgi:uncharacterized membrane protein YtjA (UPF0391 family)